MGSFQIRQQQIIFLDISRKAKAIQLFSIPCHISVCNVQLCELQNLILVKKLGYLIYFIMSQKIIQAIAIIDKTKNNLEMLASTFWNWHSKIFCEVETDGSLLKKVWQSYIAKKFSEILIRPIQQNTCWKTSTVEPVLIKMAGID